MAAYFDRRITHYKQRRDNAMFRGFIAGLAIGAIIVALVTFAADANAKTDRLPPAWRTWLEVCSREQPKPGRFDVTKWSTPNWHQTHNHSYLGGCGMTLQNYADVRRKHWAKTMDKATPAQQLWACHFLFWKYARIGQTLTGSYEGGQRYGSTVWDVHTDMGWYGFERDGKTWQ